LNVRVAGAFPANQFLNVRVAGVRKDELVGSVASVDKPAAEKRKDVLLQGPVLPEESAVCFGL